MSGNGVLIREGDKLRGNIVTLTLGLEIELSLNPAFNRSNKDSPKYVVNAKAGHGRWAQVGVAWEKEAGPASPRPGEKFLTMALDDPSWDSPLNVSAFPREGGNFEIVYRRPPRGQAAIEGGANADAR